jgi:hypothetical protein
MAKDFGKQFLKMFWELQFLTNFFNRFIESTPQGIFRSWKFSTPDEVIWSAFDLLNQCFRSFDEVIWLCW